MCQVCSKEFNVKKIDAHLESCKLSKQFQDESEKFKASKMKSSVEVFPKEGENLIENIP